MKQKDGKPLRKPVGDDGWRLPDALWAEMEPLLPPRPKHPLGCHNPRVPDRAAMDAIFFVLRTGGPWNALRAWFKSGWLLRGSRVVGSGPAFRAEEVWCAGMGGSS